MLNISKENEFSPNKLLNGSEIKFYQNITNNTNIITSQEFKTTIPIQKNIDNNRTKKNNTRLIRPELEFLKITKIKLKSIKEIITSKFDKSFKELNINIKNKKLLLAMDICKLIEDIRWKLIEEINDLEILNKDYEKKFNTILNHKTTQRNHSHYNNNNTNMSSFSNSNKRNSFSDNILPNTSINDINNKKIISSIIQIHKTPKYTDDKKKSKIPYMKRCKSGTKLTLNKSITNKSYNEIKLTLTNNKTTCNIHDYIKNQKNKNILNISGNNTSCNINIDESLLENNIINSFKIKIEEKEKELNYIKEKLENEKILNKNLLHELDQIKYNKSVQKTKEQFNQILNKNNSKVDELIIITNKLTKLIEMVINFSYSMAHLRSNIFSREKMKKNESIKSFENLSNNLKQIYNEFETMNKNLKNICSPIIKCNESKNKNNQNKNNNNNTNINNIKLHNNINNENKTKNNAQNNINDTEINNNISNNINANNNSIKKEEKQNQESIKKYNNSSSNKYKEISINSPIKEENSLEITNEEKINVEEIKKNLNDYTIKLMNPNENISLNLNNINKIEYKHLNIIQNKNRHENDENDFEKSKKSSLNFFMYTNSDKIFTFRNNSLISNKEGDKITDKSGSILEAGKPIPLDINKIIEENQSLKMQLASEMLKNNGSPEKSDSHNDEEYEEIISGLKKKLEEKDNKINELQKMINSNNNNNNSINSINNSFKNKSKLDNETMNNSVNEMEKIKGNYQENISTIQDLYENMINEKENKIKELTNEVNIIEKELEELNDKYDKEKENSKLNIIKINELENEKMSLLDQINSFKVKEKEIKNYEKEIENLKEDNKKLKAQLNDKIDDTLNINNMKNYISNYENDNYNENNFNSASNRQINKQKEELILLKKKFKEILDSNNKLTNEVNDYNLNQVKEKEEFIEMMRNTFTKFLKASKIDNKNKEYAIIILKLLGYNENDIKEIFKSQKKGLIFGIFQ